jgi:hypothetical protein
MKGAYPLFPAAGSDLAKALRLEDSVLPGAMLSTVKLSRMVGAVFEVDGSATAEALTVCLASDVMLHVEEWCQRRVEANAYE